MLQYLLLSITALGISYLLYLLFLKKEKTLVFNRFYLLGTVILCLLAPSLHFDYGSEISRIPEINLEQTVAPPFMIEENVETITVAQFDRNSNWKFWTVVFLYSSMTFLLLFRFSKNLWKILELTRRASSMELGGLTVVPMPKGCEPSSFFHYLFIDFESYKDNRCPPAVLQHEKAHSNQYHSIDVLVLELLSCFFWLNPFIWLYKKAVVANHEFLADAQAIDAGINLDHYTQQIIQAGNKNQNFPLISGFSFILTKNRLTMLHTKVSSKAVLAAKIASVSILFAAVFILSSFNPKPEADTFVVIVDAGHGGHDTGSFNEKDINLQISRELKALSNDKEVKIVLIRETDDFLSLAERGDFIKAQNADMLLSLHCNSAVNPEARGLEAFFNPETTFEKESRQFSEILVSKQLAQITDKAEIKSANFLILRDVPYPAVLIEMGFLTNELDKNRLSNPDHQKEIAENLYQGLQEIRANR